MNEQLAWNKTGIMSSECHTEWSRFKDTIGKNMDEYQNKSKQNDRNRPNKYWITEYTLVKFDERKIWRQAGIMTEETEIKNKNYRNINEFIKKICDEIEDHSYTDQTRGMFQKGNLENSNSKS